VAIVVPYTANDIAITDAFERELMADDAREPFVVERDLWPQGSGRKPTVNIVASGFCQLRIMRPNASEQAVADRLGWTMAYAIDLADDVDVTPADRIILDGHRRFEIGGFLDLGHGSTQKTLIVREVSA
jgi:hypothetical protein